MISSKTNKKQDFIKALDIGQYLAHEKIRKEALKYIEQNDFPDKNIEEWRNTNLAKLIKHSFVPGEKRKISEYKVKAYDIPGLKENLLVFVNGFFMPQFSNFIDNTNDFIVTNMQNAKIKHKELFDKYFEKTNMLSANIFSAFNTAFAADGTFIYIKNGKNIQNPIHVMNFSDGDNNKTAAQQRNLIIADKNSDVKIIFSYHSLTVNYTFRNIATEIFLEQNSKVNFNLFQGEGDDAFQINNTRIIQKQDSRYTQNTITLCGSIVRNDTKLVLDQPNAETMLNGLMLPDREQHFDNYIDLRHKSPHCTSKQIYKSIVDNKAVSVFFGKVTVERDAQKTVAEQANNNILLSDYAKAWSKPQLVIYADDVKASHGSTTGQLDNEAIFYLKTRGIGDRIARTLLLNAFAGEVIDNIEIEMYKNYIKFLVDKRMSGEKVDGQCAILEDCGGC